MGIDRTLTQKHRLVPGGETVAYRVANTASPIDVADARRRPATQQERDTPSLRVGRVDTVWILAAERLAGIVPAPGDSVTAADGNRWIIERVDCRLLQTEYHCYAVKSRG